MHSQKKLRKISTELKDRGDIMRRNKKDIQPSVPRDRGDVRRKRSSKQELFKTKKTESVKTDLVTRSTNTSAFSVPLSFETCRNVGDSPEKGLDFRKRIKDRYTFKRKMLRDEDLGRFNEAMRCDVRKELPKSSYTENVDKLKSKDLRDAKILDKASVNRAVSAMKIKRISKSDERKKCVETEKNINFRTEVKRVCRPDDAERKKPVEIEKNVSRTDKNPIESEKNIISRPDKRPLIKTIKSNDTRVYKAVTFVEETARKPLNIKIPKDLKSKSKSKIPKVVDSKIESKRRRVQQSPSLKSADSYATEIAKWVPESVDQHTRPYYDAWVSKTATVSTKLLKEADLEKSRYLRSLELQMRKSPELIYDRFKEEEYAGRIRVRRKDK